MQERESDESLASSFEKKKRFSNVPTSNANNSFMIGQSTNAGEEDSSLKESLIKQRDLNQNTESTQTPFKYEENFEDVRFISKEMVTIFFRKTQKTSKITSTALL